MMLWFRGKNDSVIARSPDRVTQPQVTSGGFARSLIGQHEAILCFSIPIVCRPSSLCEKGPTCTVFPALPYSTQQCFAKGEAPGFQNCFTLRVFYLFQFHQEAVYTSGHMYMLSQSLVIAFAQSYLDKFHDGMELSVGSMISITVQYFVGR